MRREGAQRILSFDLRSRWLAYVVFEWPDRLLDCGMRKFIGDHHVKPIADLLGTFRPSVAVLRTVARGDRRNVPGVRRAINLVRMEARRRSIPVETMSARLSRSYFRRYGRQTKYQIASFLAAHFPPLANRLPPPRKKWKPEDRRMSIFDAAEIAVAYLALEASAPIENILQM